jgi:hypothetical protein
MKIIRYYSMGKGIVAVESAGTLFQVSAKYGQGSCHTSPRLLTTEDRIWSQVSPRDYWWRMWQ